MVLDQRPLFLSQDRNSTPGLINSGIQGSLSPQLAIGGLGSCERQYTNISHRPSTLRDAKFCFREVWLSGGSLILLSPTLGRLQYAESQPLGVRACRSSLPQLVCGGSLPREASCPSFHRTQLLQWVCHSECSRHHCPCPQHQALHLRLKPGTLNLSPKNCFICNTV